MGAASPSDQVVFNPASPQAWQIHGLSLLVLAISAAIFLLTEGFLVYCLIRYRHRKRSKPDTEPPQFYGSAPVEVAWTVLPLLIVFVIFLVVVRTTSALRTMPDDDPVHVTVIGHQWWWEYQYYEHPKNGPPKLVATTANEMHVPTGRTVVLTLDSADVIHSFWVPRLNGKTDVIPGHPNQTKFEANASGLYLGNCTEFCGAQHANMLIRIRAQPAAEYAKWLASQAEPAVEKSSVRRGEALFARLACSNCHTVRGTEANGDFGPDLTHLMSRETLGTGIVPNDRAHLAEWIRHPQKLKPGCNMPNMHLAAKQVNALTDYLLTLR